MLLHLARTSRLRGFTRPRPRNFHNCCRCGGLSTSTSSGGDTASLDGEMDCFETSNRPTEVYMSRVATSEIQEDLHQRAALIALDSLYDDLLRSGYAPPLPPGSEYEERGGTGELSARQRAANFVGGDSADSSE